MHFYVFLLLLLLHQIILFQNYSFFPSFIFQEYLTTDGQCIRTFMSDGRKKKTYATEEPMDKIAYCGYYKQYVGWFSDGDELFVCRFHMILLYNFIVQMGAYSPTILKNTRRLTVFILSKFESNTSSNS